MCGANQVCVPRLPSPQQPLCALLDGRQSCPAGLVRSGGDLFATVQDDRKCGPCTCTDPMGGDCAKVKVQLGNAGKCDGPTALALTPGAPRACVTADRALVAPGMQVIGTPTPGSCTARSALTGTALLTDPKTLCCTN